MKALIIVAHGSRRIESNNEFITLSDRIAQKIDSAEYQVRHAFLELTPPSLFDVFHHVIKSGITYIEVYPYFLNAGVHIEKDIPAVIASIQSRYPDISIHQFPYIGAFDGMADLIISQIVP